MADIEKPVKLFGMNAGNSVTNCLFQGMSFERRSAGLQSDAQPGGQFFTASIGQV